MKLQSMAIIFVLIIVPISFVMAQYLQTQIDTIKLQTAYNTTLITATHDALKAFQVNSANNKYSSISDSKIRDIEASINTFYNSLGTKMQSNVNSKDSLYLYVPAIVFTLYDGYYIYSSYNNIYNVIKQGDEERVRIQDSDKNYQDALKPYIYYSCQYTKNGTDRIIVNYTLDNAITVYGDLGKADLDGDGVQESEYTYSGYLINPNDVKSINNTNKTLQYKGVTIRPETLTEHLIILETDTNGDIKEVENDYNYIVYNNQKVYLENASNPLSSRYFWYNDGEKKYLQSEAKNLQQYIDDNGVGFKSISGFEYYNQAVYFSKWVNDKLTGIRQSSIVQNDGTRGQYKRNGELYLSVDTGTNDIFDTTKANNDPMLSSSIFNSHRMAVIQKSIETNLTTAIANYNNRTGLNYEFVMPVINAENWYNIANNVSIISFMQGMIIGQKYYNNYSVVTNTRNEEVINEQSVYILAKNEDGNLEYHQPGCENLIKNQQNIVGTYTDLSFLRQSVKVNEVRTLYFYPQTRRNGDKNFFTTGCYNCIVNASGGYNIDDIVSGTIRDNKTGGVIYNTSQLTKLREAYLTGIARERFDLYKSNFN